MKKNSVLIGLFLFSIFSCQHEEEILIRFYAGGNEDFSGSCGYRNLQGTTIIEPGNYSQCFTDTLKTMAIVLKQDGICIAIDKHGQELYEVYWYDNGPDYLSEDRFRILKNGKIGYADPEGNIVIEPAFECASPFESGKARVTYSCELVQVGEHTQMESDAWFYINPHGAKLE